jgi:hypothetical protein
LSVSASGIRGISLYNDNGKELTSDEFFRSSLT